MKRTMTFYLITFFVVLTGCATRPADINPRLVNAQGAKVIESWDCAQLVKEAKDREVELIRLNDSLVKKARDDRVQLLFALVFPPGWFLLEGEGGPEVSEYSELQGEYKKIRETAIALAGKCNEKIPDLETELLLKDLARCCWWWR